MDVGTDSREMTSATMGTAWSGSISRAVDVGTDSREMTSVIMGTAWSGEHQPGSGCGDRQS